MRHKHFILENYYTHSLKAFAHFPLECRFIGPYLLSLDGFVVVIIVSFGCKSMIPPAERKGLGGAQELCAAFVGDLAKDPKTAIAISRNVGSSIELSSYPLIPTRYSTFSFILSISVRGEQACPFKKTSGSSCILNHLTVSQPRSCQRPAMWFHCTDENSMSTGGAAGLAAGGCWQLHQTSSRVRQT